MTDNLLAILRKFNRKERFFLIGEALGNNSFSLSNEFRLRVATKLNLKVPSDAFVAMDYHLDWIYASLFVARRNTIDFIEQNDLKLNKNQEDIDLLIAFKTGVYYHLILIEAKAETGWTNKQLNSKASRLKEIFGNNKCIWENVIPHFLIISPRKPRALKLDVLPPYLHRAMENIWLPLNVPDGLIKITRCNQSGRPSKEGVNWKIEST